MGGGGNHRLKCMGIDDLKFEIDDPSMIGKLMICESVD
jgi:hypothetical protein